MERLRAQGIETRPIFSPVHLQDSFRAYRRRNLPVAEACSGLNLPSSVDMNQEELLWATEALKNCLLKAGEV
jgi:dTDP-4-amino-4,6-dideoxygalactose transaminase